jgi:Putative peptidoglycan binding domain
MMGSRFFSRNGMSSFAQRHDPAFGNRFVNNRFVNNRFVNNRFANNRFVNNRFANNRLNNRLNNRFANNRLNNRFANNRFVNNRFVNNRFFVRNHFFVGFNFGAFGWWPGWWWGGPWWWGWDGWAYPYPNCGYAGGYGTPCTDPPAQHSRYGSEEYWNDVAMSVQSKLAEQSYYHGAVDGVLSSDTLEAIRQFQTDHGLALSGKIDPKLLDTLGIQYNKQNDQQNEQQSADTNKS